MDVEFNQRCECLVDRSVETLIIAVSGGVDSIVLLDLSREYAKKMNKKIVVAHFNHKLRTEADDEEKWLEGYCKYNELDFISESWYEPRSQSNLESEARRVRYDFFKKVYDSYPKAVLMTGHHKNDLAETILMKLSSGSRFKNLVGIKSQGKLSDMLVVRPMLNFSKEQLYDYAEINHLEYFEDESNKDCRFKRNRVRHKIIPAFLDENPQFLNKMVKFSKEVTFAADIIDKHIDDIAKKVIAKDGPSRKINLVSFFTLAESERHFVLEALFQEALIESGSRVTDKQMVAVKSLLSSHQSNGRVDLENGWQFIKSYEVAELTKNSVCDTSPVIVVVTPEIETVKLPVGKLMISKVGNDTDFVEKAHEFELGLQNDQFPLVVRNWQSGDRLIFNQEGQHKKISRMLIDKKIPKEKRASFLVLVDNKNQILSLFLGEESYLSISQETDKIHYRLTYSSNG